MSVPSFFSTREKYKIFEARKFTQDGRNKAYEAFFLSCGDANADESKRCERKGDNESIR